MLLYACATLGSHGNCWILSYAMVSASKILMYRGIYCHGCCSVVQIDCALYNDVIVGFDDL